MFTSRGGDIGQLCCAQSYGNYMIVAACCFILLSNCSDLRAGAFERLRLLIMVPSRSLTLFANRFLTSRIVLVAERRRQSERQKR